MEWASECSIQYYSVVAVSLTNLWDVGSDQTFATHVFIFYQHFDIAFVEKMQQDAYLNHLFIDVKPGLHAL